ncbi:MAG: sugar nucleotide-binding protein [Halioglobus sp.]|nr:sugar nucleotide-binding protein [Halioglobus sp.]
MVRALLLGSDTPLGHALLERHYLLQRHEMLPSTLSACRWKSERQAKKSVVRAKCDIVVDLRIEAAADGGIPIQELDLQRCRWVAKACQRNASAYLYVSSSRVFSGALGRHYSEDDQPDNEESIGTLLRRAEELVAGTCQRHLILRPRAGFFLRGNQPGLPDARAPARGRQPQAG